MAKANSTGASRANTGRLNLDAELAAMRQMSPSQLQQRYAEVFGEATRVRHKQWLIKRIAWRLQANAEGDLSERARKRAAEIACDADIRMMPPKPRKRKDAGQVSSTDRRLPPPGQTLNRVYKGQQIVVIVREHHFEWEGQKFTSLSALAKAVTGSHMNGYRFFKLGGDQ